ncbi:MAG TPA: hypothetical protein VGI67_00830 [Thermoleophilaceae bacterium]
MSSEVFWTRRLRWRLRGALTWPAFAIFTIGDGLLLHYLPPNTTGVRLIPGLIIASFANLFLIGAVAGFISRRLVARERRVHAQERRDPLPAEVILDRTATILLSLAAIGLFVAGLGNRPVIVSETNATHEAAIRARNFVLAHGTPQAKDNLEDANTRRLAAGYFRICVNLNDRAKAYCMFVDTNKNTVVYDHDSRPNPVALGGGF